MCAAAAQALGCKPEDVLVSSTGVIGQRINVEAVEAAIPGAALTAFFVNTAAAAQSTSETISATSFFHSA